MATTMLLSAAVNSGARGRASGFCRLRSGTLTSPFPPRVGSSELADVVGLALPFARRDRSSSSRRGKKTTPGESSPDDGHLDGGRRWTLLYHRRPSRSTQPRALLGVSTFNLAYWTWYVADFAPSINDSARAKAALGQIDAQTLEMLLIDPNMGYVGLGMAGAIWLGSFFYTRQLVSAIWAPADTKGGRSELAISTSKLPFLTQPKILGRTVYDPESNDFDNLGDVAFSESELRSESTVELYGPGEIALSEEQRKNDAIVKFDGEFGRLRGHVALKKVEDGEADEGMLATLRRQRYLLDIESGEEFVKGADPTLLHSLVLKDYHLGDAKADGGSIKHNKRGYRRRRGR